MSVLTVTIYEFRQFLQILMWIAIPLVVVSVLITIIVHYWRKRKQVDKVDAYPLLDGESQILAQAATLPVEETEAYKGIIWLRNKYQHDIELAGRKNEALRDNLAKAEQKYADLVAQSGGENVVSKLVYDATTEELQHKLLVYEEKIKLLESQVADITQAEPTASGENLPAPIDQVSNEANACSQDQSGLVHSSELQQQLAALQEILIIKDREKDALEKRVVETVVLQDMTAEKNKQISFLQQQLDERIQTFHEVEFRQVSATAKVVELQEQVNVLNQEKQHWQQVHQSQAMTIEQSQVALESLAAEQGHIHDELHQKLEIEIKRSKDLEGKLYLSSNLLQKIVKEINDNAFTPQQPYLENGLHNRPKYAEEGKAKISAWIESPSEEEEIGQMV